MCAEKPGPPSASSPNTSPSISSEASLQQGKDDSLSPFLYEQISFNTQRHEKLLQTLPKEQLTEIQALNRDLDHLKQKVLLRGSLADTSQAASERQNELRLMVKEFQAKYPDFDFFYISTILYDDIQRDNCEFYFEVSRSMYINKKLYYYEVKNFILSHKEAIFQEFAPPNIPEAPLEKIGFHISLNDPLSNKLDSQNAFGGAPAETHHFGKSPVFITFHSDQVPLFKVVYKPRDAKLDKAVIDTFRKINSLSNEDRSSETPLPVYHIKCYDDKSVWEYINGENISKQHSAGVYVHQKYGHSPGVLARLDRLDAVLTKMGISDLHKENVKIRKCSGEVPIEIIPVDLENLQPNEKTQLGGSPEKIALTLPEKELIQAFCSSANDIQIRYLPLSTHIMAESIQDFSRLESLTNKLLQGFTHDKLELKITPAELQRHILISMLNNDVPYFTFFQGKAYYGSPKEGILIGIGGIS